MKKFSIEQKRIYDRVLFTIKSYISEFSVYEDIPFEPNELIFDLAFDICDIFNDTNELKFNFKSDLQLKILEELSDTYKNVYVNSYIQNRLLTLKINLGV